ncbi:MAG: hypothetical protein KKE86_04600, partial [Planctomycetes bacterium]|nr:hypothetical protein [Planctomycetota bacterium]
QSAFPTPISSAVKWRRAKGEERGAKKTPRDCGRGGIARRPGKSHGELLATGVSWKKKNAQTNGRGPNSPAARAAKKFPSDNDLRLV